MQTYKELMFMCMFVESARQFCAKKSTCCSFFCSLYLPQLIHDNWKYRLVTYLYIARATTNRETQNGVITGQKHLELD